jgi:hypothetical protein
MQTLIAEDPAMHPQRERISPMNQADTAVKVERNNSLRQQITGPVPSDWPQIPKPSQRDEVILDLPLGGIALVLLFLIWIASKVQSGLA